MNELKINGTQSFMNIEIPIIEGGFGNGRKCVLAKTISEIHETPLKRINELISENIDEFEENIDIIDLKNSVGTSDPLLNNHILTKQSISNSKNIYILSEQGYMALISLMRTEKSKEIRKQFRREYFSMREIVNSLEQEKASLLLTIYTGGQDGILATRQLVDIEVKEATTPLLSKIEEQKPMVDFANHVTNSSDSIDIGELSKLANKENIKIGRNRLFEFLRKNKMLMDNNIPYQRYIDNGYFKVIETTKSTPYGDKTFCKTLVQGKGQMAIIERLRNNTEVI